MLVIGTYRAEDVATGHPLLSATAELTRSRVLTTVQLPRLTKEQVAELAVEMANADVAAELVDVIHQQTNGNPLFVEEMMRSLLVRRKKGTAVPASELEVSEGLQHLIERRASRLSEPCRRVQGSSLWRGEHVNCQFYSRHPICSETPSQVPWMRGWAQPSCGRLNLASLTLLIP